MGWKEQGKKRYNKLTDVEGLSPTLRPSALMKNSQENIIVNQPKKEKEIQTQNFVVSGQTSGTSTQPKSTGEGSGIKKRKSRKFNANQSTLMDTSMNHQNSTKETSEQLILLPYQNTPSSVRDFLAKVSVLLGSEADLQILEAHSSLKLCESLGLKEPRIYSLRTSKDYSPMMKGIHSKPSSERWMNLGMMSSGKCLTAKTSESRRTGSECSLSQILEDNPDRKYFLSEKRVKYIQNQMDKSPTPLTAIITKDG